MPKAKRADSRHLMRYISYKANVPVEEIARQEHVNIRQVRESIKMIEAYEHQNSEGQMQIAIRDLFISAVPQAKETLNSLLTATTYVTVPNGKTGNTKMVEVEDKTTRLEAVKVVASMAAAAMPKTPMVAIQNNNTNQVAHIGSAETPEERMRRLRQQARDHAQLPAEVAGVPEYIDAGGTFEGDTEEDDEDDEE